MGLVENTSTGNLILTVMLASLCGSEVNRWVPSPTLENLLAIGITTQASLELKGHNFLSLDFFLNISHLDRLPTAKKT